MTHIYANENVPLPTVRVLRALGHDALTTADAGNAGKAIPDDAVLAFACSENRVLLTLNRRHFVQLHQIAPDHCGIIACSFDPDPDALAQRIHAAIAENDPMAGRLVRVNRPDQQGSRPATRP